MNKTNYKQYNTKWAKLGYPKAPHYIRDCGCGEVAICNAIIEMQKQSGQTPKTIQPYCKQYAAPNGDGTYFSGIPKMMEHYGMTEVKEHANMASLWKELEKGDRIAIYLMGNRKGGSKQVHWTSSAHFVCSVGYKKKDGKHLVYVKDSNSTSDFRNGWISYKDNMRNDVSRVWSGKLNGKLYSKPIDNKIAKLANEYAYTSDTSKADYPEGSPKTVYKEGLNKAYPNRSSWGTAPKKGASCDVFVGTCVRNSGIDKSFPRGLDEQIDHLAKSKKFKEVKVTTKTVKDGDIILYSKTGGGGHICIACGGKIKEAGYKHYYPKTTNTLSSRLSKKGKKWLKVYRAVT